MTLPQPEGASPTAPLTLVPTASESVDERTRVLKQGDTFAVFNRRGDADPEEGGGHGLYHEGTRHLSRLVLLIDEHPPLVLGSSVTKDNSVLDVDLTNPALRDGDALRVKPESVHIHRSTLLCRSTCIERVRVMSYDVAPVRLRLCLSSAADFADIFEVRGLARQRRGALAPLERREDGLVHRYLGLDGIERRTELRAVPPPDHIHGSTLVYDLELAPHEERSFVVRMVCESNAHPTEPAPASWDDAHEEVSRRLGAARARGARFESSNEKLNAWLERSSADLYMMMSDLDTGPYPYAGVPWYSTVFGRDGLLTAYQMLLTDPEVARGVLCHLAATQASSDDPANDAERGKILHEARGGEMAALGEHPFQRYYGTVDATPLFVFLAGEYLERTADLETLAHIWPSIEAAMGWVRRAAGEHEDGLVRYARRSHNGLLQQGWKDSEDSVFYEDGALVEPPVALVEVQAYAYGAHLAAARVGEALGHSAFAKEQERAARALKATFEGAFFSEELGTYALALDGQGRPCKVLSSNAGHALLTGLASPEGARRATASLMGPRMFSGWGIRTLGEGEPRYNPMSYHNGSVWPHDNALCAMGMARYGHKEQAAQVLSALFDVSRAVDLQRLPELYCGFVRRPQQGPTLYPVACAPQAWASGAVLQCLQACLGLRVDAAARLVTLEQPSLPPWIEWVRVRDLPVAESTVDLLVRRAEEDVAVEIERRRGESPIEVVVKKRF